MSQRAYLRDTEKERFWRGVVQRHAASGQGVREFCRAQNVSEGSFYAWRRTLVKRDQEASEKKPARKAHGKTKRSTKRPRRTSAVTKNDRHFVPLAVVGQRSGPHLEIVAPSEWRVRVPREFDPEALCEVFKAVFAVATGAPGEAARC